MTPEVRFNTLNGDFSMTYDRQLKYPSDMSVEIHHICLYYMSTQQTTKFPEHMTHKNLIMLPTIP